MAKGATACLSIPPAAVEGLGRQWLDDSPPHGVLYLSADHAAWPAKFAVTPPSGIDMTYSAIVLRTTNVLPPETLLNFPVPPLMVNGPPQPSRCFPVQLQPA
jgi:hypothetical protein